MLRTLIVLTLACLSTAATAVSPGASPATPPHYTVVAVDTRIEDLRLFLTDGSGKRLGTFERLRQHLSSQGNQLKFAMNAGIYQEDGTPLGLLVMNGRTVHALNTRTHARGNFYTQPNGVFLLGPKGPRVVPTADYPAVAQGVRFATQSGPMLVINGEINPGLSANSSNRNIRNGVGVNGQRAYFVISDSAVTFHEFAAYFRDTLHCQDALYLDGAISGIYWPKDGRNDETTLFGPMVAVVE
jgi:uncharacterized protein YigE (DUF2233 family)